MWFFSCHLSRLSPSPCITVKVSPHLANSLNVTCEEMDRTFMGPYVAVTINEEMSPTAEPHHWLRTNLIFLHTSLVFPSCLGWNTEPRNATSVSGRSFGMETFCSGNSLFFSHLVHKRHTKWCYFWLHCM